MVAKGRDDVHYVAASYEATAGGPMELLLADPTLFGVFKIVGAAIAIVAAIPFIIGLVIGGLVGRAV